MSTDHSVSLTYSAMMSVVTEKKKQKKLWHIFFFTLNFGNTYTKQFYLKFKICSAHAYIILQLYNQ